MATEPNTVPEATRPKVIRLVRPSVVVLCGPAACGKSTFAAKHFRPTQIISSDQARALVCDDERDQRFQTQAFALVHFLVEQRLSINRLCVVDSTALTLPARRSLLELARRYHVPAVIVLFDVPLETCLEYDAKRERAVGRSVIERHYQAFEQAKLAVQQEGFDQVIELRGEHLDRAQIEIIFRPVPRAAAAGRPEASLPARVRRFVPGPAEASRGYPHRRAPWAGRVATPPTPTSQPAAGPESPQSSSSSSSLSSGHADGPGRT